MPYQWSIDDATRTVVVRGFGAGTTADTLKLINDLALDRRDCSGWDLLYDALALRIESSPADLIRVAGALFQGGRARFRRCALVLPPARVGLGRIFVALAHPFGVQANVFGDVEAAREWLAVRPVPGTERGPQPPPLASPDA